MRLDSLAVAVLACAAAGCAQSAATDAVGGQAGAAGIDEVRPIAYACSDGSTVEAAYVGKAALLHFNGRTVPMSTAVSASGARYVGAGWQWWTKGAREAWLSRLEPGETYAEPRGTECTAKQE